MSKPLTIKDTVKETRLFGRRAQFALGFVACFFLILSTRLVYLQIFQHKRYQTLSDNNRINVLPIAPTRGLIVDRHGQLLADNIPDSRLDIIPEQATDLQQTIKTIAQFITITTEDIDLFYKQLRHKRRFEGVTLRFALSEKERALFAVNRYKVPGAYVAAGLIRTYPYKSTFAHALGYVGRINEQELKTIDATNYSATPMIGKTGIEHYYEKVLHGKVGYQKVEIDAHGRVVRVLSRKPPIPGDNLTLSLDVKLQSIAERAIAGRRGAVIAVDTQTGEILSLVSNPSFDPNGFVLGMDQSTFKQLQSSTDRPLFNRAIRGQYPPGSTVKPIFALQALQDKVINPRKLMFDPGWYQLPGDNYKYRDWKRSGHGWINMRGALAQSCSTYFYALAPLLGIDAMQSALRTFGFGQKTTIDLSGQRLGLVPSRAFKRERFHQPWFPGETLITGIGQGFLLVTPIQLAQEITLLANHGKYKPLHLLVKRTNSNGHASHPNWPQAPQVPLQDNKAWNFVINAMHDVTHNIHGTAYGAFKDAPYTVAAKTGTAQVSSIKQGKRYDAKQLKEKLRDHSLFIGFAPIKKPRIALAIILENNTGSANIARQVMDAYFS